VSTDNRTPDKLAIAALKERVPDANAALVLAADFLECSARNLNAFFDSPTSTAGRDETLQLASAYASVAYLLHALHANDQGAASDAAWELQEMGEAGEPLADWVGDQLGKLGIDAGALGRGIR